MTTMNYEIIRWSRKIYELCTRLDTLSDV